MKDNKKKGDDKKIKIDSDIHHLLDSVVGQTEDTICFAKKKLEHDLSSIGAKVADANDLSQEIQDLSEKQEKLLEKAQAQTSEIYEALDDLD